MSFKITLGGFMASNALVQTRIDSMIKDEAAIVLAAMGLTVSDAVRLMLTRVAHDHALPFDVLTPNTETVAAMREARLGKLASAGSIEQFNEAMRADD
jgi:DNA-damage-inducible protein J